MYIISITYEWFAKNHNGHHLVGVSLIYDTARVR